MISDPPAYLVQCSLEKLGGPGNEASYFIHLSIKSSMIFCLTWQAKIVTLKSAIIWLARCVCYYEL